MPLPFLRVGDLRVHVLSAGRFRLDGGAMFGVVPKVLWSRELPADELNRVTLGLNCLLVLAPDGQRILVDTGLGDRWSPAEREQLGLASADSLHDGLTSLGLSAADIDVVINSHLHFDHAGGNVTRDGDGRLVPAFPGATHVVQEVERHDAHHPHERTRASYRSDDFAPLEEAGRLRSIDGTAEIAPGVFVDRVPGHCPGMQVVRLESRGEGLVFPADLVPTSAHLRPAWNMGYDLDVTATVLAKRQLLDTVLSRGWTICFDHDPDIPLARLTREEHRGRPQIRAVPVTPEAGS